MKRSRLSAQKLPTYSVGEEIMNMVTHIVGGAIGILTLVGCLLKAVAAANATAIVCAGIYGFTMLLVYTVSSVYHGLKPCNGKKVMQILDHCAIYLLIAGTYTPITLLAFSPAYPAIGYGLTLFQWFFAVLALTLTAIDMKKFKVFSMLCYICTGWAILPFMSQAAEVLTQPGFLFLLWGGISYTVGAILYGIGSKQKWFHSIFHIFVVLGSVLQLICVYFYVF